eukprot:m.20159 g.20159  ORF g.20159 m.20159 type:complete len:450 (-) comp3810_c0_seq1:29-1378(-)
MSRSALTMRLGRGEGRGRVGVGDDAGLLEGLEGVLGENADAGKVVKKGGALNLAGVIPSGLDGRVGGDVGRGEVLKRLTDNVVGDVLEVKIVGLVHLTDRLGQNKGAEAFAQGEVAALVVAKDAVEAGLDELLAGLVGKSHTQERDKLIVLGASFVCHDAKLVGDEAGGKHAECDSTAVADAVGELDGMANGVAVLKDDGSGALLGVVAEKRALGLDAHAHELEHLLIRVVEVALMAAEDGLEDGAVLAAEHDGVLCKLARTGADVVLSERLKDGHVDHDGGGDVVCADNVLEVGVVDSLLLGGDAVVGREKGGGDVDEADAAEQKGRGEAKHVADNAAAEGNDNRVAGAVVAEHLVDDGIERLHRLVGLTGVSHDDVVVNAVALEGIGKLGHVQIANVAVAANEDAIEAALLADLKDLLGNVVKAVLAEVEWDDILANRKVKALHGRR